MPNIKTIILFLSGIILVAIISAFVYTPPSILASGYRKLLAPVFLGLVLSTLIFLPKRSYKLILSSYILIIFSGLQIFQSYINYVKTKNNAVNQGVNFSKKDFKTAEEILLEEHERNNLYPNIPNRQLMNESEFKDFLPLGDISDVNTLYCNELGDYVRYKSSDRGFRTPELKKVHLNKDNINNAIYMLGDSYTQGACVEDGKTIADNIYSLMKVPVYSYGQGASSIGFQYAIFREYIEKVLTKTDIVIINVYPRNDYIDLNSEMRNSILYRYISEESFSQNLDDSEQNILKDDALKLWFASKLKKYKSSNSHQNLNFLKELSQKLAFVDLIHIAVNENPYFIRIANEKGMKQYMKVLEKLYEKVNAKEAKLVVACIPSFNDRFIIGEDDESCNILQKQILKSIGIKPNASKNLIIADNEIIDSVTFTEMHARGLDLHFNEKGYDWFALQIYNSINKALGNTKTN